jgi:hypothetical protein
MSATKIILRVLGWLVTIILQVAVSYLVIFLFSVIFAGVDNLTRLGWLELLFMIWLGYVVGINLVGYVFLRWVWKESLLLPLPRLIASAVGAAIPLVILLPIGYSTSIGDAGSRFYDLVTNTWQPILAQAALLVGLVGYYVPGIRTINKAVRVEPGE